MGHRGARAFWPDNTVAAFRGALVAGAAGSEFDVRLTADGACVCLHDATLPDGRMVCDALSPDIRRIQLSGPAGTREPVAFLPDALAALAGSHLICEIKNHPWDECYEPSGRVVDAICEVLPEGSTVACFDPVSLGMVPRDRFKRSFVTAAGFDPMSALDAAIGLGFDICAVEHVAIDRTFVEAARSAGIEVHAWATDEPDRVRALNALGVSVLMADDPARALAALR